jgi:hypothetical protein
MRDDRMLPPDGLSRTAFALKIYAPLASKLH